MLRVSLSLASVPISAAGPWRLLGGRPSLISARALIGRRRERVRADARACLDKCSRCSSLCYRELRAVPTGPTDGFRAARGQRRATLSRSAQFFSALGRAARRRPEGIPIGAQCTQRRTSAIRMQQATKRRRAREPAKKRKVEMKLGTNLFIFLFAAHILFLSISLSNFSNNYSINYLTSLDNHQNPPVNDYSQTIQL